MIILFILQFIFYCRDAPVEVKLWLAGIACVDLLTVQPRMLIGSGFSSCTQP